MEWWRIVIRVIPICHPCHPAYRANSRSSTDEREPMINTISLSIHSEWKMFWGNIKGQWAWINIFKWLPPPHLFLQSGCETTKAEHATTRETHIKQCEIICTCVKLIDYNFIFSPKEFDVWFPGCLQRGIRGSGFRGVFGARINFIGLAATLPVPSSSSIANLCIIQKCDP